MKREIKFRGKRTKTERFVYGYYMYTFDICYNSQGYDDVPPRVHYIFDARGNFYEVDPETVGQDSGLKDRNGKEIYEGDIVRYPDAYMNGVDGDWDEVTCVGEIKWDDDQAQFYVTNRESIDNEDFWEAIDEAEVIGNRWDNPDLLEG
ncbi:YopX family protein [Paenibacillus sp. BR1-192]|uniref:YopX family protein n=1 Tax=Paenibacillus sp. BR1-192 TaxID=3032287 RepID=UPI00240E4B62|nr:YopX family protein [Paenibacillus sp. BR1-192]WFB57493.1 YopX family protein [Paenibacillus sp. BR1-192]